MREIREQVVIDFKHFGGPVYAGRDRGKLARIEANVDELDQKPVKVLVKVSESAYTLTSSFLLGLFGASIRSAGSRENFLSKYQFEMPAAFQATLDSCIQRSLIHQSSLLSDD